MDPTARVLFSSGVLEIRPTCLRGLESHSLAPLLAVYAGCNLLGEAKARQEVGYPGDHWLPDVFPPEDGGRGVWRLLYHQVRLIFTLMASGSSGPDNVSASVNRVAAGLTLHTCQECQRVFDSVRSLSQHKLPARQLLLFMRSRHLRLMAYTVRPYATSRRQH